MPRITDAWGGGTGTCVVFDNADAIPRGETPWKEGRDVWWQDCMEGQEKTAEVEWVGAEDPLFLLYTSGSTGKPKVRKGNFPAPSSVVLSVVVAVSGCGCENY